MASLVFRFDVDTHKCARDGVPNLVRLGDQMGVKFTFFVNCGRAVSVVDTLSKKLSGPEHVSVHSAPQLSALQKLGKNDYLWAALVNPKILSGYQEQLSSALKSGHELGLHGGRNHEIWMSHAQNWSKEKIRDEIQWGLDQLKKIGVEPTGFASPGARCSGNIKSVLYEMGFRYFSDDLDPKADQFDFGAGLLSIPTRLCGEMGVAYIEALRAQNFSTDQILKKFETDLQKQEDLVLYDHPYFAGVVEIELLQKMIEIAKKKGRDIITMNDLSEAHYNENSVRRKAGA